MFLSIAPRTLLFVVFALAVLGKLSSRAHYRAFVAATAELATGRRPAAWIAPLVVICEVAICGCMFVAPRFGCGVAIVLLLAFTGLMARAIVTRRDVACRCFASSDQPVGIGQIVRNLVLIATALAGLGADPLPLDATATTITAHAVLGAVIGLLITQWDLLLYAFGLTEPER